MIKKTTLLLALIVSPAACGMDVKELKVAVDASHMTKLTSHYLKCYQGSEEEKIGKLKARISKLDSWIAKMEKAPRALDKLAQIDFYEHEIRAAWEAIDILNGQQPSELEKSVTRLSVAQSPFESFIKERCEEQKAAEYYNKHNKSATQPMYALPSHWNLSAAILSDDPEAATKIAAQRQATQIKLGETANPKEKAKLVDDSKWLSWLEKVAKK